MKAAIFFIIIISFAGLNSAVIFVINSGSETLSKIDTESGEVDNSFAVPGSMPNRLVCDQEIIYIVNSGDNAVQMVSTFDGSGLGSIYLGTSVNPYDLIMDEEFLYVSGGLSNQVYKIDLQTNAVIDQTGVGTNPAGLALAEGKLFVGNTDYMGNYAGSSVSVIDLGSFEVTSTIPVNANPQYLLADEGCLHVSCGGNWADVMGSIQIIDIAQEIVTETIELGGYCGDLALSEEGIVYVADAMNTGIYAYNAQNWEVIYSPAAPFTPGGSVVEADQGFLAVLGGMWGENFTVNLYNLQEEHLADFQVALYGTDLKFLPEAAGELENELSEPEKVISYPNPFFEYVKFETTGSRELIKKIAVFDIRGRKVAETELNIWDGYDLYGKKLPSGIYLSRIYFQDGGEQVSKIIKIR